MDQSGNKNEIFVALKSYPNYYISNYGNVINNKLGYDIHVVAHLNKLGYPIVELINKNGERKKIPIYILVAKHFVKKDNDNLESDEIAFIDKNRLNHKASNLKWI